MKKSFAITILVIALLTMSFSLAMAKTGKVNLEGEIIAVDEGALSITIRTIELEEFTINFSPDEVFAYSQADLGSLVHVKAKYQQDGTLLAIWVKSVDEGSDDEDDGNKENSAYCSGEKDTAHPVIIVLSNKFDKTVEELMGYFCDGFGIGQIYLALKTETISGQPYEDLLALRSEGQGWGKIWEDLGYNGKPKNDEKTPPGQDKDKDKEKDEKIPPGQDKDKDKEKDEKIPPGQDKDKEKKPKKNK